MILHQFSRRSKQVEKKQDAGPLSGSRKYNPTWCSWERIMHGNLMLLDLMSLSLGG